MAAEIEVLQFQEGVTVNVTPILAPFSVGDPTTDTEAVNLQTLKQITFNKIISSDALGYKTHDSLQDAAGSIAAGDRILVLTDETVDTQIDVTVDNVFIYAIKGVTLTKGTASIGINLTGNDCKIENLRFADFTSSIALENSGLRNRLYDLNFSNCNLYDGESTGVQTTGANRKAVYFGHIVE